MCGAILKHLYDSLKDHCTNLQTYENDLKELQDKLEQTPEGNENEISLAKFAIKNKENEIKSTELKLEEDGKGMATAMAGINGYDLTDDEKKFWDKFNKQIMANWNMNEKCTTCNLLLAFSG